MQEHVDHLTTHGFCVLKNFFPTEFIEKLKAINAEHRITKPLDTWQTGLELYDLYTDKTLIDSLTVMGCTELKFRSSFYINKFPGEVRRPWHQDWFAWDEPVSKQVFPFQIGIMIYFCRTDETNGCLEVIPGSHRKFMEIAEPDQPHPDGIHVKVEPGDVLIADARLLHATGANTSSADRPMMTMWYYPNWSLFTQQFRAWNAIRDSAWEKLGSLLPTSSDPPCDFKVRRATTREDYP